MGIEILGTGKFLPPLEVKNEDFVRMVDTSDEWIQTRTGIKTRHIATDLTTWEMGTKAAEQALMKAKTKPDEIDLILATTITGDYVTPGIACMISNGVKAYKATCIDINCACAGFVYALDMSRRYLDGKTYKKALIVSSEMLSKVTDYTDRSTCVLFGDGAGAVVVEYGDKMFESCLGGDSTGVSKLFGRGLYPNNPFMKRRHEPEKDGFDKSNGFTIKMDGKEVYKFSTTVLPYAVREVCNKGKITPNDLDLIIAHQANKRIVEAAARHLKLPIERFFIDIHKYGNTSSASIPIGLADAEEQGLIKKGDKVCFVGFGAGLTYGSALIEI